jgi:MFS family permease
MVQSLHLAPTEFSVLFAAVMLGQISGGIIGSRLVARLGLARMVRLGALPFGLGALVSAVLAETFDGTTRPMAVAIALFGLAAYLTERFYFRKFAHG